MRTSRLSLLLLYLVGLAGLAVLFFPTGWSPFWGVGDTELAEHLRYLLGDLLVFQPWPQLREHTDLVFYPFGTLGALQPWVPERELVGLSLERLFGPGPWLQGYALASFAATGLGAFLLLRHPFGRARAVAVAFAVTFFNFYALLKYPAHHNLVTCHWAALSVLVDFLLYRELVTEGRVRLAMLECRVLFLLLVLGTDLGYLAGFALTSFVVTALFAARELRGRGRAQLGAWRDEWRRHPGRHVAVAMLALIVAWLYVPLGAQLLLLSRRHSFPSGGTFWPNPVRWLVPWFPFLSPADPRWTAWLGDRPEAIGDISPGWTLLVPALLGLWSVSRRRAREYRPLLVFFALLVLFHPTNFPTLRLFPWSSMVRVAGRITLLLPLLLSLLAIAFPWERLSRRWRLTASLALPLLAIVELTTAWSLVPRHALFRPSPELPALVEALRAMPGEAVLDWPFCVLSGNGITESLCPFPQRASGDYALQRFHGKRTVGLNYGRLNEALAAPYLESGWHHLLTRRGRCLSPEEWRFFDEFFTLNDFGGILLHRELAAELDGHDRCPDELRRRYGAPVATATLPGSGAVELYRKPAGLRARVDREAGKRLRYSPAFTLPVDLAAHDVPGIATKGLPRDGDAPELALHQGNGAVILEWHRSEPLRLEASLRSEYPGQQVRVTLEGRELAVWTLPPDGTPAAFTVPVPARPGRNRIELHATTRGTLSDALRAFVARHGWRALAVPREADRFCRRNRNRAALISRLRLARD